MFTWFNEFDPESQIHREMMAEQRRRLQEQIEEEILRSEEEQILRARAEENERKRKLDEETSRYMEKAIKKSEFYKAPYLGQISMEKYIKSKESEPEQE